MTHIHKALFVGFAVIVILFLIKDKDEDSNTTTSDTTSSYVAPTPEQVSAPVVQETTPPAEPAKTEPEPEPQQEEAAPAPVPQVAQICYEDPQVPGVEVRGKRHALQINCQTRKPLHPEEYRLFMQELQRMSGVVAQVNAQRAAARGQDQPSSEVYVQRQMVPQAVPMNQPSQGPVMHGGVLDGMPIMDGQDPAALQEEWDRQRNAQEAVQHDHAMGRLHDEAVYQCRKVCHMNLNPNENVSLCLARCGS